jgi:hypothetical protein
MQAEPIGAHPLLLEKELAALPRIDRITMNSHVSLSGLDSASLSLETDQLGGAWNGAAAKQHHTRLGIGALGDWAKFTSSGLLGIAA